MTPNHLCPSLGQLREWRVYCPGLETASTLWPEWTAGFPPTLVEFAASTRVPQSERIWLLAHMLHHSSRRICLFWAADCVESALRHVCDKALTDRSLEVLREVRHSAATGEPLDSAAFVAISAISASAASSAAIYAICAIAYAADGIHGVGEAAYGVVNNAAYNDDDERTWQITRALNYLVVA